MTQLFDAVPYVPGASDGLPGFRTLPGSGLAVPGGLECVFQYRGLLLNVQQNVDRYQLTSLDGLADPDIRDTRDVNTNSDGETPYNSFYGGRTVVISGAIRTYSLAKMRDMQQALRAAFADLTTEYPLWFRTGDFRTDHVLYCKKISSSTMTEQQSQMEITREFQISLRASNPCFLSYYQKLADVSPPVPVLESNPLLLTTAVNAGNYNALPIFRVYGPSSGSTFTNDATGQSFSLGAIPTGDYLEFNIGCPPANRKYLINKGSTNEWNLLSDDSQYMYFQGAAPDGTTTGENNIFYYGDASRVQIAWFDTYI